MIKILRRFFAILLFLCLSPNVLNITSFEESPNPKTRITFDIHQSYNDVNRKDTPYAMFLSKLMTEMGSRLDTSKYLVDTTASFGSFHTLANVENLSHGNNHIIGLVQSDAAFHHLFGNHDQFPIAKRETKVRSIAKVFEEIIYIGIVKEDSLKYHSDSLNQFLSKSFAVNSGLLGSGHNLTAINIKNILYPNWKLDPTSSELYIRVQAPNRPVLPNTIFIGLDEPASKLISNSLGKVYSLVDNKSVAQIFDNSLINDKERYTFSQPAILITDNNLPNEIIDSIKTSLDYVLKLSDWNNSTIGKIHNDQRYKDLPITPHIQIIKTNITSLSRWIADFFTQLTLNLIFITALVTVLLVQFFRGYRKLSKSGFSKFRKVRILSKRHSVEILIFFGIIAVHIAIGILIWLSEYHYAKDHNANVEFIQNGIGSAILWVFQYAASSEPSSNLSSYVSYFWVGIIQFGWVVIASVWGYYFLNKYLLKMDQIELKDHVVIIGWNSQGRQVIQDIKEIEEDSQIAVVGFSLMNVPEDTVQKKVNIEHEGIDNYFEKVDLLDAKSIIILSDKEWANFTNQLDLDSWTFQRLNQLNRYYKKKEINNRPHLIVEIIERKNVQIAKELKADEVICVNEFAGKLIAQSVSRKFIVKIFSELFKTENESNEIYYISPEFGKSNRIRYSTILKNIEEGSSIIGVVKASDNMPKLNPSLKTWIRPGDKIIVIRDKLI